MEDQYEEIIEVLEQESEPQSERIKAFFKEMVETVLIAMVLILVIEGFTDRVKIEGYSMLPSLEESDRLIVSQMAYRSEDPARGDIVVFDYPNNPDDEYIKRVIGIPGDILIIEDGAVYVNGEELEEDYTNGPINGGMREVVVPEESVFVMGDNRNHSSDSRYWGPLPNEYIVGKAVFIYWPFSAFGVVETPEVFLGE